MSNIHGDNNTGSMTYAYLAPAGYTGRIDATRCDDHGPVQRKRPAHVGPGRAGNNYQYLYNSQGQVYATVMPDGSIVDDGYDPLGNRPAGWMRSGTPSPQLTIRRQHARGLPGRQWQSHDLHDRQPR